jgi:uncharacterized protein YycO
MAAKYSQIRKDIQTGDLLAWRTNSIGGASDALLSLYQKIFKAEFSHVGMAVVLGSRVFVVEAIPPVVRIYPLSLKRDFHLIKCNVEQKDSYIDFLFKWVGDDYSLLDLAKTCLGFSTSTQSFYCSELAADFYKYVGLIDDASVGKLPQTLVDAVVQATKQEPILVSIDGGNI